MILGELSQAFGVEAQRNLLMQLGYPLYLITIVGVSKIAGAIVLILPRVLLLKVSAYPCSLIPTSTAFTSHLPHGGALFSISPLIVTCIAITACLQDPSISFIQPKVVKPDEWTFQ